MAQLVRVDLVAERDDPPVDDLQREHPENRAFTVGEAYGGLPVGDDRLQPDAHRQPAAYQPEQEPGDRGGAVQRVLDRRGLASAVGVEHDVVGQHPLEPGQVAVGDGREELLGQLPVPLGRGLEPGSLRLDALAGTSEHLATVGLALVDDLGDVGVVVAEGLAQQEDRTLQRAEPLQSTRNAVEMVSCISTRSAGSGSPDASSGSGSQVPTYRSRRCRAERSASMASRLVTVVANASGDSTFVPLRIESCMRRNASCTTSSASATLPSMR